MTRTFGSVIDSSTAGSLDRAPAVEDGQRRPPAGIRSLRFWWLYMIEMRPYLLFVSAITGVAGMSLAPGSGVFHLTVLTSLFFLAYGFGQALTDCFQLDTDALSAPYRPLAAGEIRRRNVLAVSLAGLVVGGLVLVLYNPVNLLLASTGIAGLATYTFFKRRWWGGPFYNAWIVAVLCLIGYASGLGAADAPFDWTPEVTATLLTVLFAYANFVLVGYYKDISADRATGYRTLPVVFGLRASAVVSDALAVASLAACGAALYLVLGGEAFGPERIPAVLLAVAGASWVVYGQFRLHGLRSEGEAHVAIAPTVHSYILLLSAIAVAGKPYWLVAAAVLYAGFVVTAALRPMKEQI
jgi:4-hydroxybenzoate polyprenyltransferase